MSTINLTLGSLIDETIELLLRPQETPARLVIGSDALSSSSTDTTLTLSLGAERVNTTDILEFGNELVLVTAKSSDSTPIFTVARGYLGTDVAAHATGEVGGLNPTWPRYRVKNQIIRSLGPLTAHVPLYVTEAYYRTTDLQRVDLPVNTIRVLRVAIDNQLTGKISDVGGWDFRDSLPTGYGTSNSGKVLVLPAAITNDDELLVTRRIEYSWASGGSTPASEADTVAVPLVARDIPALYAAARLVSNREVSRIDLDRMVEWNNDAAKRSDSNLPLIRQLWSDFYRRIDEVRPMLNMPTYRPFRKAPGLP